MLSVLKFISSGLYVGAKALRQAGLLKESMDSTFNTLRQAGEELPRNVGDAKLISDMQATNDSLQKMSDDYVLSMPLTSNKKIITLQKIYSNLADLLHYIKPSLICAASLRMVELTLSEGLTPSSPLAFAYYGEMLAASGNLAEGCRLGMSSCVMTVISLLKCVSLCVSCSTMFHLLIST